MASPDILVKAVLTQMSQEHSLCQATKGANTELNQLHSEVRSSCVLVIVDHRIVGIVTERDVVRLGAQGRSLEHLTVQDVMAHPVVALPAAEFTNPFKALSLLGQHHIRHLPLLDSTQQVVGLLTHETLRYLLRPVDLLRLRLVEEVMTADVICAAPLDSLRTVAQLMATHRVSCVVVVEHQAEGDRLVTRPAGIVTERDIVQFQALELDLDQHPVQTVMSTPAFSVGADESLITVQEMMQRQWVRRLVVVDAQGALTGIVTQSSMLKALDPLEMYGLIEVLEQRVSRLEAEKMELLEHRNTDLEQQVQQRTAKLTAHARREQLLAGISIQIRSSLNLPVILDATARGMRSLLSCDRVIIYQLHADLTGTVVAEAITEGGRSVLHAHVQDPCLTAEWLEPYRNGYIRVVNDVAADNMTLCHQEILAGFDIRAKLMVPIIEADQLWGLIVTSYRDRPHLWQPDEIELVHQLSIQVAIAIQQATAYEQAQTELAERKQAEVRLRESEQRYATLAATAPVGIFRANVQGHIVYINQYGCCLMGRTAEDIATLVWHQVLHPDDRTAVMAAVAQARQEQGSFQREYRLLRPEGEVIWVYGQMVVEQNPEGQVTGYVGTITDISDRKRAEQSLQELNQYLADVNHNLEDVVNQRTHELRQSYAQLSTANVELARATRLKDEFLANMSHELRTPLNAILGFSETLQEELLGGLNERQHRAIATIEKSGRHLLELINDILDLSKVSSGNLELSQTSISVTALCESSLLFVRQPAMQKNIQLTSTIPAGLDNIVGDERRLRQVLINLLINAVKFTPPGGHVSLKIAIGAGNLWYGSATVPDILTLDGVPRLLLQVTDTGIGIAPEDLPQLFQPFVQINSQLNRQETGTGLGLAMVKQITELHGGQVTVESTPGLGSCFTVALPYQILGTEVTAADTIAPVGSPLPIPRSPMENAPLVLLAEDNPANIELFTAYLEAYDYRVVVARTGGEALAHIQTETPDIILMDIQMPGMDGLEAIGRIRANQLRPIPIIALTALAMPGDRDRCLAAGADEYLSKPVILGQLVEVMHRLLELSR